MTTRQISDTIEDIYSFDVSEGSISDVTDKILVQIEEWQNRRLMMFIRSCTSMQFTISVRDNAVIVKKAAYEILGLTCDGRKAALSLAIGEHVSAKFRLNALNELGVQDIMIISAVWFTWSATP